AICKASLPRGGFFHIDIAEVQTVEGKLYLFVAIDRTSKFAVTQLVEKADRKTAWEFLEHLLKAVPYRIHTILTDNGIQFAEQPRNRNTAYSRQMRFDMICEANGIEHRLTKPNHPWTNGQVERVNRTIKEATVKRYHYDSHDQLRTHLTDFPAAYNCARRLKTLNGLTPYEYICKIWTSEPDRFITNPIHQMPGLNRGQFSVPIDTHSRLAWQTPAAFAQTLVQQRGPTLRNPQSSAPAPVAQPAQMGKLKHRATLGLDRSWRQRQYLCTDHTKKPWDQTSWPHLSSSLPWHGNTVPFDQEHREDGFNGYIFAMAR
ncbi:Integrase core domain-containing protein, partial [Puniceibacterium sediminis]